MYPNNGMTELNFSMIKKITLGVLYIVNTVLLFVKWFEMWGMKFSMFDLIDVMEYTGSDGGVIFMVSWLVITALICVFSFARTFLEGRKIELSLGFIFSEVYTIGIMIIVCIENGDMGSFGVQLTAAPVVVLIISLIGIVFSFLSEKMGIYGTSRPMARMNVCPNCGRKSGADAKFCPYCSTSLDGTNSAYRAPTANIAHATAKMSPRPSERATSGSWETAYGRAERRCPSCGSGLDESSAFCPFCGMKVRGADERKLTGKRCLHCGNIIPVDETVCRFCGFNTAAPSASRDSSGTDSKGGFYTPTEL